MANCRREQPQHDKNSPRTHPSEAIIASVVASVPTVAVDARALLSGPHGIATYTGSLLRELADHGSFRPVATAHRTFAAPAGVETAQQWAPSGVAWQQLVLPLWLRRTKPTLFWSPLQTLPVVPLDLPLVTTVHDLTVLSHPEAHTFKVRLSQVAFLRASLERADAIVAISQATADAIASYFPRLAQDKVTVVHNGVDADFLPASLSAIDTTRSRLGTPNGYILSVGTLEPRKNLALLLDAWELLRRANNAPELLLVGPAGWGEEVLRRRIQTLRPLGLRQLGVLDRNELVATMQAASVFVYPSRAEGFGLPPAESMACAVPTVACNISSLPEVVGDGGVLVDPDDAPALATALRQLLEDPAGAARLAARGRERARRFTWSASARGLEATFTKAIAARQDRQAKR